MIKPTELRIGNLVKVASFGKPKLDEENKMEDGFGFRLFVVNSSVIRSFSLDSDYLISPIPITMEWLIKLGFTQDKKGLWSPSNCWHKYAFRPFNFGLIKNDDQGTLGLQPEKGDSPVVYALLHYVHQIQNLHFALTEKELTVSL